jgi:hypothetical protein
MRSDLALPQIASGNLDIAVVGQLPPSKFALGDEFEPGPVKVIGFQAPLGCWGLIEQGLEHAPGDTHHAFILADADAELDGVPVGVPAGVGRKAEEHEIPPAEATENVRVKFSNSAAKGKGVIERFVATGRRPIELPVVRVPEVCEGTGNRNGQPTNPEWNAQAADLHVPPEDDPQQMHYRHDSG